MSEQIILSLILSAFLLLLSYKFQSLGMAFIAALGFLISGLKIYQETMDILPLQLLLMIAFCSYSIPNLKVMR